jgi:hypothetical protein
MHVRRASRSPKHALLVYHRAALTHVAQVAPFAITAAVALLTLSLVFAALALAFGEVALVLIAPRSRAFQASVDERLEREDRAVAAAARAHLLARMSDVHVSELGELEGLAAEIRTRGPLEPLDSTERGIERVLGIERLLVGYVRLAIAHRRNAETFSNERWLKLSAHGARLETPPIPQDIPGADWIARRRSILEIRRATWIRANQERETMQHTLAAIADIIRWVHELSAVPSDDPGRASLDTVLTSSAAALSEIHGLDEDVVVDAGFFDVIPEENTANRPSSAPLHVSTISSCDRAVPVSASAPPDDMRLRLVSLDKKSELAAR